MSGEPTNPILRHVRALSIEGQSDLALLDRFAAVRDESAFAALVERHGPMVLGVARRVLPDEHAAEDVFQAAFLVLARKAGSIRKRESLGSWLHGVALRLAHKAKAQALRAARPDLRPTISPSDPLDEISWREVRQVLDAELQRLPERYRLPLVLCYLEGRTRDEAAAQLGWSAQQVKGQLERGRERLRGRLVRRGIALSTALSASLLTERAATAVPPLLAVTMVPASLKFATGQPASACGVSTLVAALAEGAVKTMTSIIWKTAAVVVLLAGAIGTGVFAIPGQPPARPVPANAPETPAKVEPPVRATFIEERLGKPPMRSYHVKLELTNARDQPVWLLLRYYGDEPLKVDGRFATNTDGTPQTFTGMHFDGDKNKGSGKVIEIRSSGRQGFRAFLLPPRAAIQFDNYAITAWDYVKTVEVWEVSALKVNGKTRVQEWLPYPTMSDQKARIAANTDWDNLDWDAKTLKSRIDYPNEKITSVDATVLKKWSVPIDRMPPAKPPQDAAGGAGVTAPPNPPDLAPGWRPVRTIATTGRIHRLGFSPDNRTLVASTHGALSITAWDVASGKSLDIGKEKDATGGFLAFTPENEILTFEYIREPGHEKSPKRYAIVNRSSGKQVRVFETDERDLIGFHAALSPDGKVFADGRWLSVKLWDVATGNELGIAADPGKAVRYGIHTLAFSPDGQTLAAGSGTGYPVSGKVNGSVALWDVKTRKLLHVMESQQTQIEALAFSPDGKLLAGSGVHGSRVWLWDTATGKEIRTFEYTKPCHQFFSLAFSPDGKTLAANWRGAGSGDTDAGVALWDVATGRELAILKGLRQTVEAVAFSPDGKFLAAADSRGSVQIWEFAK